MLSIEKAFHQAMIELYETAKKECGYNATRFIQLVGSKGGLAVAKQLICKEGGTDGFTTLWECGRLDLSVEAHVLQPKLKELFTEDERKMCKERLKQFGYPV